MKFPPRAFRAFWDLHAWFGVVAGLFLHVMFLAGAVALFRGPIELWQEPSLHRTGVPLATLDARVEAALVASSPAPEDFWLLLNAETPSLERLVHFGAGGDSETSLYLASREGPPFAAREGLADFLFGLHYLRFDVAPWMQWVGALLAVVMLLVVVTGLLIQLHHLVRQLHQFRLHKGWRVTWSDLHKVLGVMGLPFQTIYAFSGAFILLMPILVDIHAAAAGRSGRTHVQDLARFEPPEPATPRGPQGSTLSLDALVDVARREVPGLVVETIEVRGHRRDDGWLVARGRAKTAPLFTSSVWVRERDGAVLGRATADGANAYKRSTSWLTSVHYAHFASLLVRAMLALLALATCATILSGNALWLARREGGGHRFLEHLNTGIGAGAITSLAATFAASRVLPLSWDGRVAAEQLVFFAVLAASVVVTFAASRDALRRFWWKHFALAGALFVITPLLERRWSSAGLFGDERMATVVAVDAVIELTGVILLVLAARLRAREQRSEGDAGAQALPASTSNAEGESY